MRKKQSWMIIGRKILAYDKPGTIIRMDTNMIDGIDYVYYIHVKLDGEKHDNPYHPNDIKELEDVQL